MTEIRTPKTQLLISDNGTLYHIDLKRRDDVPKNILLVGAASRVDQIAEQFDCVDFRNRNKARPEFYIVAGKYKNIPVAAFSIGIGVDNVEIVINELHALFEYDPDSNSWSEQKPEVNIVRIGTCGTSLPSVNVGDLAISSYSIGLDNLAAYYCSPNRDNYSEKMIELEFSKTKIGKINPHAYCSSASPVVISALKNSAIKYQIGSSFVGITTASPGFYAPEGRQIGRLKASLSSEDFLSTIQSFSVNGYRIINHEIETSILFRLGYELLEYNVGAICLVLDNLATNELLDHAEGKKLMDNCIQIALDSLVTLSNQKPH